MRNIMRLLISRAMRNDANVPVRCFAEKFVIPKDDICDCVYTCKYNTPPPSIKRMSWTRYLPR
jgi:hypothetical protein